MADRTPSPTWNYASALYDADADAELFDDPTRIDAHLRDLVAAEVGRAASWKSNAGCRRHGAVMLLPHVTPQHGLMRQPGTPYAKLLGAGVVGGWGNT
jgi:hypothetical protein